MAVRGRAVGVLIGALLLAGCATVPPAETAARKAAAPHETQACAAEAAGKTREAFQHYHAALQAVSHEVVSRKEYELMLKLVDLAARLDPAPAIPDEARRYFDRAEVLAREAQGEAGYLKAIHEYDEGLRRAPWDAKATYNMALLAERINKTDTTLILLNRYLLLAPHAPEARDADAPEAREVQKKIAELEVKKQKTGIGALAGTWRMVEKDGTLNQWSHIRIDVQNGEIVWTDVCDKSGGQRLRGDEKVVDRFKLQGQRLTGSGWKRAQWTNEASPQTDEACFG
jgi:hypothetical protein